MAIVFGSQSISGQHPNVPDEPRQSMEADVAPGSNDPKVAAHDLAASELAAFRDKDRDYVRTLLAEGLIEVRKLILRVRQLERTPPTLERILKWIEVTQRDLAGS